MAVRFLDYFGALAYLAKFLDPVFVYMGLPGSTAIVFITSIFLPLYAPLAIITSMPLTLRELTILALMCQISHNLPVESAIQAKTGTSFWSMSILRIAMSIITGVVLNLILPQNMGMPVFSHVGVKHELRGRCVACVAEEFDEYCAAYNLYSVYVESAV